MQKPLILTFDGERLVFQMHKIDRSRLYGFKEFEVFDENGQTCRLATLADDGKTIVGIGGTGIGYLTVDGEWTDKSKLKPIDLEGKEMLPIRSSFAAPISLIQETSVDDYLNHNVRLVYRLTIEEQSARGDKLMLRLREGGIYKFPYSFRGGLEADVGFLLLNNEDQIFFLVAQSTQVDYLGLRTTLTSDDDQEAVEESELMDFDMI
jgi:hypothetical protein